MRAVIMRIVPDNMFCVESSGVCIGGGECSSRVSRFFRGQHAGRREYRPHDPEPIQHHTHHITSLNVIMNESKLKLTNDSTRDAPAGEEVYNGTKMNGQRAKVRNVGSQNRGTKRRQPCRSNQTYFSHNVGHVR